MENSTNNIPAVDRALNVLEFLGTRGSATVKEISEVLRIPIVSTSRLVKTLVNRGYLQEIKGVSSMYSLGIKMLNFSRIVYQQIDLGKSAEKHMRCLSDSTSQTSQLAVLQYNSVIYINQVLPWKPVSIIAPLFTPVSLNISACGKVLCAWMEPEIQAACIDAADLVGATGKSIVDKDLFAQELKKVRNLGYAADDEEFAKGIGCMAAPIFDHSGKIVAAVGITGHIEPYKNPLEFDRLCKSIKDASDSISREIGYV